MKRPDRIIDELNGTLPRPVVEYIAHLEGWIAATRETVGAIKAAYSRPGRPAGRPKTPFTSLCGTCRHSRKIPAHEKSDKKFLVVCDESTYGLGEMLIQQCRQLGPCGPEAVLREED